MERRLDAIRDVLLHVETNFPFTGGLRQLSFEGIVSDCSVEELKYATYLLLEIGYLDGMWEKHGLLNDLPRIRAIKHDGHEFLELARQTDVWNALETTLSSVEGYPRNLEVLKEVAKRLTKEKLDAAFGEGNSADA